MRHKTLLLIALGLPSILCGQTPRQATPQGVERIAREVRHQLIMLPYYNVFDDLKFTVKGYDVTLMGQVTNPTLKKDAERAVKTVEGVENVDNQIEVLPNSGIDDQLRLRLYRAIYGYPSMEKYAMPVIKPIRIIVKNGQVILEGIVDNESDKNVAGIQANTVSGVFSVTNDLTVSNGK